jgi:hypothetical protein
MIFMFSPLTNLSHKLHRVYIGRYLPSSYPRILTLTSKNRYVQEILPQTIYPMRKHSSLSEKERQTSFSSWKHEEMKGERGKSLGVCEMVSLSRVSK